MGFIRNLLALVGLLAVAGLIWAWVQYGHYVQRIREFDEGAVAAYTPVVETLLETGNGAEAMIWKFKVADGLTPEDVEQSLKVVANELNFKNVGEDLPLYQEVSALSGKDYRFVKIYMFCNALTAAKMLDYSDAFSAFLPCRITLIEDPDGQLWLYTLNMDLMIYGGKPLPPELKEEAIKVKEIVREIMERGAQGDF
ncbi:MAG: DUF302 domain-containing protein [Gammaproteobacteria bacterium]|jgi:hypothetical protein|nr:DUF302 domain-containing protein [Gammaproteobacteria bacterium]